MICLTMEIIKLLKNGNCKYWYISSVFILENQVLGRQCYVECLKYCLKNRDWRAYKYVYV